MAHLEPIPSQLFFSKNDPQDPRLGEMNDPQSQLIIQGYPDDEGIRLNGGRPGAELGPNQIREYLYKMTPALGLDKSINYFDRGNWIKSKNLREHHLSIVEQTKNLYHDGKKILSFGGGHDYGYVDVQSFLSVYDHDAVVINFDAHFDVRPDHHSPNSGTAFFRLLNENKNFHFYEIGIQAQCNSREHLKWLEEKKATIFTYEKIRQNQWQIVKNHLYQHQGKKLFISLDIDVFSNSFAPGCSQSWATGLQVDEYLEMQKWLLTHFDVRGLGIYEVSPPLDVQNMTAKLAALIGHQFIHLIQG